jgi:hypothetical protein
MPIRAAVTPAHSNATRDTPGPTSEARPPTTSCAHAATSWSELVLTSRFHAACSTAKPSARNVAATTTEAQS